MYVRQGDIVFSVTGGVIVAGFVGHWGRKAGNAVYSETKAFVKFFKENIYLELKGNGREDTGVVSRHDSDRLPREDGP